MSPLTEPWPEISAAALERLDRCERLFELTDWARVAWPAPDPEAPDAEARQRLELGEAFHRLAHLQALGMAHPSLLDAYRGWDHHETLIALWDAFTSDPISQVEPATWSEHPLRMARGPLRWTVRFDRLVRREDGQWLILDWKTGGAFDGDQASNSWQTRLYRYSAALGAIAPERVTLIYWHVPTGQSFAYPYSQAQWGEDREALDEAVARIGRGLTTGFQASKATCHRCRFRTLCHPASDAGRTGEVAPPAPRFLFPET